MDAEYVLLRRRVWKLEIPHAPGLRHSIKRHNINDAIKEQGRTKVWSVYEQTFHHKSIFEIELLLSLD